MNCYTAVFTCANNISYTYERYNIAYSWTRVTENSHIWITNTIKRLHIKFENNNNNRSESLLSSFSNKDRRNRKHQRIIMSSTAFFFFLTFTTLEIVTNKETAAAAAICHIYSEAFSLCKCGIKCFINWKIKIFSDIILQGVFISFTIHLFTRFFYLYFLRFISIKPSFQKSFYFFYCSNI